MSKLRALEYKWLVGIVFVFGLFMDLLDMTIVNVALPTLAADFHATTTDIEWVVTGYLLSLAVFIPFSGWAGDRFGTKNIFMLAQALFLAGSLLSGMAWSIESLIFFRVLQGVGGGMLTPVGTAMLFRAFPQSERAAAGALLAIPAVVAPAVGPVLGGYLVEYQSWRWIFLVNVPIGVAGLLVSWLLLKETVQETAGRLDLPGFLLSATGLASIVYALSEAGPRGFGDIRVLTTGSVGLALLALFTVVELRTPQPMIDVRLFGHKLFRAANIVMMVGQGGFIGALFLLPLLLQAEMGFTPLESGLATFPQAFGVIVMVQVVSRLYKKVGPRRLTIVGLTGAALTTAALYFVGLETSAWVIRGIMIVRGGMMAFLMVPLQTAAFATVSEEDTGRASAVFNANRQISASLGVAILATALTNRMGHYGATLGNPLTRDAAVSAFHDAFLVAAVLSLLGILSAFLIDDREARATMAHSEAEEREPVLVH